MVQSPTERLTETAARAAVGADRVERDREAWNLPRAPVGTVTRRVRQRGLDWEDFRDLYYPGTRRHNFRAMWLTAPTRSRRLPVMKRLLSKRGKQKAAHPTSARARLNASSARRNTAHRFDSYRESARWLSLKPSRLCTFSSTVAPT
jgi:hypothetical protein